MIHGWLSQQITVGTALSGLAVYLVSAAVTRAILRRRGRRCLNEADVRRLVERIAGDRKVTITL